MNCLVLGGSGFLGKNLCRMLLRSGHYVRVYSRDSKHLELLKKICPGVDIRIGEFSQTTDYNTLLEDIELVFHLISTTKPSNRDIRLEFESNVLPSIHFLEACTEKNIRIIYFSSGGTVYGIPRYIPLDEKHRTDPISAYGIHKLSVEKCIEYFGHNYGLNYVILRISNPYGAYQDGASQQGAIAVFIAKALRKDPITIWGTGEVVRDYIYVEDVMGACMQIMSYQGGERIFNVGNGKGYSLKEIIEIIQGILGYSVCVKHLAARTQDVPTNVLDNMLLRSELGWQPTVDIEQGIRNMICMLDMHQMTYIPSD